MILGSGWHIHSMNSCTVNRVFPSASHSDVRLPCRKLDILFNCEGILWIYKSIDWLSVHI